MAADCLKNPNSETIMAKRLGQKICERKWQ